MLPYIDLFATIQNYQDLSNEALENDVSQRATELKGFKIHPAWDWSPGKFSWREDAEIIDANYSLLPSLTICNFELINIGELMVPNCTDLIDICSEP